MPGIFNQKGSRGVKILIAVDSQYGMEIPS